MMQLVKELDWRMAGFGTGQGTVLEASALGLEVFYRIDGAPGNWTLTMPGAWAYIKTPGFETQIAAKAAAQSDFAQRIRSELVPSAEPESAERCAVCGSANMVHVEDEWRQEFPESECDECGAKHEGLRS